METDPFPDADTHVIDSSLFILFEPKNAIDHLERATAEYDVTLVVPQRVYEELTPAELPYETPPVDDAKGVSRQLPRRSDRYRFDGPA